MTLELYTPIPALFALTLAMFVLALLPGPGLLIVVSRTLTNGIKGGVSATLGMVTGDLIFVLVTIYGLSMITNVWQDIAIWIRYIGAGYLLWLSVSLIRQKPNSEIPLNARNEENTTASAIETSTKDYTAALLITLSNPKAFLFYGSLFPAFIDLQNVGQLDIVIILLITIIAIGGTMVGYTLITHFSKSLTYKKSLANKRPSTGNSAITDKEPFTAKLFQYLAALALTATAIYMLSMDV